MRTNIDIDDVLLDKVMSELGIKTKKEAVEEGLKALLAKNARIRMANNRGKMGWEGDLDQMRTR